MKVLVKDRIEAGGCLGQHELGNHQFADLIDQLIHLGDADTDRRLSLAGTTAVGSRRQFVLVVGPATGLKIAIMICGKWPGLACLIRPGE